MTPYLRALAVLCALVGHVTGHGLTIPQQLKLLGNGVVPQQALLALSLLDPIEGRVAA